jgi:hypothetical protein
MPCSTCLLYAIVLGTAHLEISDREFASSMHECQCKAACVGEFLFLLCASK